MDERERRVAQNEALFRDVNERVRSVTREWAQSSALPEQTVGIVCECGKSECSETVGVTPEAYEDARAHGARFVVRRGHEVPDLERVVVDEGGEWIVVEKTGEAKQYVEHLDPRSRT